ncbi:hypothetical protein GCM10007907_16830 [Chitinimonas prasina]|uniref:Molecular chaperone DnaJ n=1 Tax=Chitinimonas prasina TaxID=1434937 RepID=A0ABQ5YGS9_9NEIS|nr:hypothetical protein GCM10007907_16830 [Chitinimonas prasina]
MIEKRLTDDMVIELTFSQKTVESVIIKSCPHCHGLGEDTHGETCVHCCGRGDITVVPCPRCGGAGCDDCDYSGEAS